jgi:hypothetical protein
VYTTPREKEAKAGWGIEDREDGGTHPPFPDEFENKGVAKWAPVSIRKERANFVCGDGR